MMGPDATAWYAVGMLGRWELDRRDGKWRLSQYLKDVEGPAAYQDMGSYSSRAKGMAAARKAEKVLGKMEPFAEKLARKVYGKRKRAY